jgi:hypothetical protein
LRIRISNRALSESEIAELAKSPLTTMENDKSMVADYIFDHEENGFYANRANSDLSAKIIGEIKPIDTDYGKAIKFTGKGYLEVKPDIRLDLNEAYTLEAWIRPETFPQNGSRIIDRITAGKNDGYLLDTCPGNSLRLMAQRWGAGFNAEFAVGEWAYIAGTFDINGEISIYLNGKLVASNSVKGRGAVSENTIPLEKIGVFYARLCELGLDETYEAKHARLIVDYVEAIHERAKMKSEGKLYLLPATSQFAADKSYIDAVNRLAQGFRIVMESYSQSDNEDKKRLYKIWQE